MQFQSWAFGGNIEINLVEGAFIQLETLITVSWSQNSGKMETSDARVSTGVQLLKMNEGEI